MEKRWMVIGYRRTGSGSLTYPEDFDIVGVFGRKIDAEATRDEMNERVSGHSCPEHGSLDECLEEDCELLDGEVDEIVYNVEEVPLFRRGERPPAR